MIKRIVLLGASGSIGAQTLDILKKEKNSFDLVAFSVGFNTRKIHSIIKSFPNVKSIYFIKNSLKPYYISKYPNIKFFSEEDGFEAFLSSIDFDYLLNALVGFVGLKPTLIGLEKNKTVLLANKESLVVGGEIINDLLKENKGKIFPIDSEHSAIKKCLMVDDKNVSDLILTASGGSFRNLSREQLKDATLKDALNHPTWSMGKKITIDSATMMNKCFEIIEAHYLFDYPYKKIKILLHDESYIHSLVKYKNGCFRLEACKPNMKNPIRFALFLGQIPFKTSYVNGLDEYKNLHFHDFDIKRYPLVRHAKTVIEKGGSAGAILNACNEVAVNNFLSGNINFLCIEFVIDKVMKKSKIINTKDYFLLEKIDRETRIITQKIIDELRRPL